MKRILVADDEKDVCDVLKEFLSAKGYEVHTALDGTAALKAAQDVRPHVMLLDIIMPGMTGIEVLKEIKKRDPSIAVIMATAVTDEELAKRTLELGAYDYVVKPFNLDYLETVVLVKMAELLG
jgi:DNA-binding response OmpR family regulator